MNAQLKAALDPLPTGRFDLELVVDDGPSMVLWQQVVTEWRALLEQHGAFRTVRVWRLTTNAREWAQLYADSTRRSDHPYDPKELVDPSGARLILVMTDCVSPAWHSGKVPALLDVWGHHNLVSLLQVFPRRLWEQTVLANADFIEIVALSHHVSNSQLKTRALGFSEGEDGLAYPVVTLEYRSLYNWACMITGAVCTWIPGILFASLKDVERDVTSSVSQYAPPSPKSCVQLFHGHASLASRKLMELLAAVPIPINLAVIQHIQSTMVPEARLVHIAEVLLSGLLEQIDRDPGDNDCKTIEYDFVVGVREELLNAVTIPTAYQVQREISLLVQRQKEIAKVLPDTSDSC